MIVAHLSDLHLGHEAFDRTEDGRNVRERDIAQAFGRAIDRLVELAPRVVLLAGDIFDRGFYLPSYPGSTLDQVELYFS